MRHLVTTMQPSVTQFFKEHWGAFLIVLASYFFAVKLGQFLFYHYDLSPAVILPSVGIALAAVFLFGNWMLLAIACAQCAAAVTSPAGLSIPITIASTIGYTIQPYVGALLLRKTGFDPTLRNTRDALILIGVAFAISFIAPSIVSGVRFITDTLSISLWTNLSRAWAGGMLSIFVMTPLITSWLKSNIHTRLTGIRQKIETGAAAGVLILSTYLIFWTSLPEINLFILLYGLLIALFWIGLRTPPFAMTFGIFILTALGLAGIFIAAPSDNPINQQAFASELFILLIGPIFLILASTVEEKRATHKTLKAYAKDLENSLQQLAHDDRSKNEFIAILAHELRNPLASIVSTFELLKLKNQDHTLNTVVDGAHLQSHAMRRLLDDLLDLSRITQQKFQLQKEYAELRTLIEQSMKAVEPTLLDQSHRLTIDIPEKPITLYVDPIRFTQILTNLLSNAIKYTEPGGHIELSCTIQNTDLVISVRDNGIGISHEHMHNLFMPFHQIHNFPRMGTGLGIGLTITRRLVVMHGGTIDAHSEGSGKGSTFVIRMPLPQEKMADLEKPQKPDQPPPHIDLTILIVDDNETAALSISRLLEYKGFHARIAHDGKHALSLASAIKPDIILLDIGLPDMDGYTVAKKMKEVLSHTKIIALTGFGQAEDIKKAEGSGFDYHLTKPAGLEEITNAITNVLSA